MDTNMQPDQAACVKDGRVRSGRRKRLYTPTEQKIVLLLLANGGAFRKTKRQICEQTDSCRGSVNAAIRSLRSKGVLDVEYRQDDSGSCQANEYRLGDSATREMLDELLWTNPFAPRNSVECGA